MKHSKFRKMSPAELAAHYARSEQESEALLKERKFREWCGENDEDYENEDAWEHYQIVQGEMSGDDSAEED